MRCVYEEPYDPELDRFEKRRCPNSARTRGLCHAHYQTMRAWVRDGKAEEADMERRGYLLPKGKGSSPVRTHGAFRLGSTAVSLSGMLGG